MELPGRPKKCDNHCLIDAYDYFALWRDNGTLTAIVAALRTQIRLDEGREPTPSAACIDSQSVKTTEVGGDERGYDGGKKIKGLKRHLLVDTLGLLKSGCCHRSQRGRRQRRAVTAGDGLSVGVSPAANDLRRQQVSQQGTRQVAQARMSALVD